MKLIWNSFKKYIKLYLAFVKNCLQAQMEYRMNFVFSILAECGWICSHLLYLMVLYTSDVSIGTLSRDSLFMFTGTYLVITGIYMSMFYTNFANIPEYLRTGQLDLFITKPLSLQFITTLRYVDFGYPIADFCCGIALILIGWHRIKVAVTLGTVAGFLLFILLGAIWVYVLQIIPALISFWTIKVNGIYSIGYAVHDMNKMPRDVYSKFIQRIGTFLFPLFPMANYPTLFVTKRLQGAEFLWGLIGPFVFLILIKLCWNIAIKRYVSASS